MTDKDKENLLANHDWSFPVPIAYGPGRLKTLGQQASDLALTHPLIVTDKGSAALPFIEILQQVLLSAGIESEVFSEVAPNPRDSDIALARETFRQGGHDSVIAIGGGSGMDATAACIVHEELSQADPGFCLAYLAHSMLFVNNLN